MTGESDIVLGGYGATDYIKRTERPLLSFLAEAGRSAVHSAGLQSSDIDGLAICSFELPPDNAVTVAEQFGLSPSWTYLGTAGGAGPVAAVLNAMRAIESGHASTVLVIAGDAYDVAGLFRLLDNFGRALKTYGTPHGFGGANGLFGLVQRKHMETYGTTRQQLGAISVAQRLNAGQNPAALLREPLTIDDYMNARVIADPIHLYDCVLPCAGAEAVVVTTADRVPPNRRVRVLAGYEKHNYPDGEISPLRGGWETFRDALWSDAGASPDDMDFVQMYDDYPIMVAIQLEDHGFCGKGEVGALLETRDLTWRGDLPLNTGGGQLSCGQCGAGGGMIGLVEAVRQLHGEGADRQVEGAQRGLVSGYGMIGYGHGLSSSSIILERT